jgi:glycosyltransferase involved in cell wall biosynthesis
VAAVSVIIPARDAAATIGAALEGLAHQRNAPSFEVILVDDRSRDGTASVARSAFPDVRVLEGGGSGPALARNLGVQASGGRYLAFVDADCEPSADWLAAGAGALEGLDLVQGRVVPRSDVRLGPFDRTLFVTGVSGLFESANLFMTRDLFARVGGFESWLRPRRGVELAEDVLLGWRARRIGARTGYCDEAVVHHEVFRRGPRAYVAEYARRRYFPAMTRRVPELRDAFLYRRYFLTRRTALFDLALVGAAGAAAARRPLLAAAALPYLHRLRMDARRGPARSRPLIWAADLAADAVGAGALVAGSVVHRTVVL